MLLDIVGSFVPFPKEMKISASNETQKQTIKREREAFVKEKDEVASIIIYHMPPQPLHVSSCPSPSSQVLLSASVDPSLLLPTLLLQWGVAVCMHVHVCTCVCK